MSDPTTYEPTMPFTLTLPAPWEPIQIVYCLYRCEKYIDDETTILAETEKQRRKLAVAQIDLDRRSALLDAANQAALPTDPTAPVTVEAIQQQAARKVAWLTLKDEQDAWVMDRRRWELAQAVAQARAFVLTVRHPDGTDRPGSDPATWAGWPLKLMQWVADTGYDQAREALWPAPKAPISSWPTPSDQPIALDTLAPE